MRIERTNNEIIIRVPSDLDSGMLQRILDLVRYGELTSKSSATEKQVEKLSATINKKWWSKNKRKYLK